MLGAGVSGLTTAICLARRGFAVTVLAERFAPRVTSVVAGALWEWPPAVCGHHHDAVSLQRSKMWCATSYSIFTDLARDPATGVFVRPVTFYFRQPIGHDPRQRAKMDELASKVLQFRHDPALIAENQVNAGIGLRDAYRHLAPMIDTDVYLRWLLDECRAAGCQIERGKVAGPLRELARSLATRYGADFLINCSGLGAGELAEEVLHPLRGALVRVRNDGRTMPRITEAHCVSHSGDGDEGFIFILPRGEDWLVLGGLAELGQCDLSIGLDNYEPIRAMHRRCVEFLPALRDATIDAAEPVRVGLRPFRERGARLEQEPGTRIIHNYGHGGSGVTLSWGCSLEVVERVEALLGS